MFAFFYGRKMGIDIIFAGFVDFLYEYHSFHHVKHQSV